MTIEYVRIIKKSIINNLWNELGREFNPPLDEQINNLRALVDKICIYGNTIAAFDGIKAIGAISFYANDYDSKIAYITEFLVIEKYRRQKVGTALLYKCFDFAKKEGMTKIRLQVADNNESAKKFYMKNGFVEERKATCDSNI